MFNHRFITYLCLIGASCSVMAMEMPEKPKNSPIKTAKIQSKKDQNLALLLNTTYEVTHEIAIDLQKSLQELKKSSNPKAALKIGIANRIPVLNELIGKMPNSLTELKKALFAFINVAIALDRAKDIALLSNFTTAYETANNLLCSTIDSFDALKAECIICAEDKSYDDFLILPCGHEYCKDCLQHQVDTAIEAKRSPCCPNPSCKKSFEYEDVQEITATNKNTLNQFNEIKFKEWFAQQKVKHCPTPSCPTSFINERSDQFTVQCKECKHEYCAQCLHPHAFDMTCNEAAEMRNLTTDKTAAEKASEQWKKQNTKACPQCKTPVEKNGGCNHMSCKTCYHQFCWNCLKDWRNHIYCSADQHIQQPREQQAPREQRAENAHFEFARDPRGFAKSPSFSHNRFINMRDFAERFERLSCEQRDEWTARVSSQIENSWNRNAEQIWVQALETIERLNRPQNAPEAQINNPAIFIRNAENSLEFINSFTISFDATRINADQQEHYTQFLSREARGIRTAQRVRVPFSRTADVIIYTNMTQAQMQEIIDAANRHAEIHSHRQHTVQPGNPAQHTHVTVHRNSTITVGLHIFGLQNNDIAGHNRLIHLLRERGIRNVRFDVDRVNSVTVSSDTMTPEELGHALEDALDEL